MSLNFIFNFGISEILGLFTLIVTILGIVFAWKAYKHQTDRVEPWSIKKVGDDLWLLERTATKLATIRGLVRSNASDNYEVKWLNQAGHPHACFRKGTTILVKITVPFPGTVFQIYYQEQNKDLYPFNPAYIENTRMGDTEVPPKNWKVWETTLY